MQIGNRKISKQDTFIIAEIGNNHNGDIDRAIRMIDLAIEMNVDCVKFQMRKLDQVYRKKTLKGFVNIIKINSINGYSLERLHAISVGEPSPNSQSSSIKTISEFVILLLKNNSLGSFNTPLLSTGIGRFVIL